MNDLENALDLETSEQAATLLDAEEALGERTVIRVLKLTWTAENDDTFCWFSGCTNCTKDLQEGEEGLVWGKPFGRGDEEGHQYVALQPYCSEECLNEVLAEWSKEYKRDLLVGYFEL